MMRKLLLFSCALIFMAYTSADTSRGEKSKTINKTFEVDKNDIISIKNSFGQVHVTTWDESNVAVEIEVSVESRSDSRLQQLLDDISVEFDEQSDGIYMRTNLDVNTRSYEDFEVNYTVKLPGENKLDVKNEHGDIYMDDRSGEVDVDLSYGDLKAGKLAAGGELKLAFVNADIKGFGKGQIVLKHVNSFSLDEAEDIVLDQQHSEIEIGSVSIIDMRSRHGEVEFGTVGEMDVNIQHTDFVIESLEKSLDMFARHASDFSIDNVSENFEFIDIEGNYGSYRIDLDDGLKADFQADFQYATMKALGVDIDYSLHSKEQNKESYEAKIGGGHASKRIRITSTYGDLRLTQ
ncbi:MAG: DUF4097 family beta strand repeat-containing protein [Cytophagales bacterium]|nr:DUF4097 family beta strand repeat-containing protein [Cytophagales bacterium]